MENIKIYELDKDSDKSRIISGIHINAFPSFFLTQLGFSFLTTLYQGYIEDSESGIIVAESMQGKQILGFIAYSKDYSRFYSELKRCHLIKFALCSIGAVIKHPSFTKRLLRALKKDDEVKRPEKYVELASIGVHSFCRESGVGGRLVDYLFSIVDFDEYAYISLETDAHNNDVVNNFYQNKGFILAREYTTAEGRRMNEYRYRKESE